MVRRDSPPAPAVAVPDIKRLVERLMSYLFDACQPSRGDVFSWMDDHAEEAVRSMLAAAPTTAADNSIIQIAEAQVSYWRGRQQAEKSLEDGFSEDGEHTPIGDGAAWSAGYCNGRYSEADWWLKTLTAQQVEPAPAVAVPEGNVLSLIVDALEDAASGMRYVRQQYGDLSGVGFDRVQEKYLNAMHLLAAAPQPPATRSYEEGVTIWMKSRMADELNKLGIREGSYDIGHDILRRVLAPEPTAIRSLADEPRHGE